MIAHINRTSPAYPIILKSLADKGTYVFVNEDKTAVQYDALNNRWEKYGTCNWDNPDFSNLYEVLPIGTKITFEQSSAPTENIQLTK